MQRYNQGFGCFGPMERCDQGKWVKAEDVEQYLSAAEKAIDRYKSRWIDTSRAASRFASRSLLCCGIAVIGWGIIAAALVKYAFTGSIL